MSSDILAAQGLVTGAEWARGILGGEQSKVDVQSFTRWAPCHPMKTFQGRQQEFKDERMIC